KREFPENTLQAFAQAYRRGANAIELDVHATRDGVVVVHHDASLPLTLGRMAHRAIAELDWDTVRAVDLGGGATVPSLADVLAATPESATVYVEIKGDGIEQLVADGIDAHEATCAVHSFDHRTVARMRTLAPDLPRGILLDKAVADVTAAMAAVGARDVWPEWRLIDATLVDQVHASAGRVIAWTVNDRAAAQQLIAWGVDGLCTDDVRLLDGL
ncbi:MAG: glycerophosphodiester phosphodiesterase, partial [Gemmatimonadaceae bacterium]